MINFPSPIVKSSNKNLYYDAKKYEKIKAKNILDQLKNVTFAKEKNYEIQYNLKKSFWTFEDYKNIKNTLSNISSLSDEKIIREINIVYNVKKSYYDELGYHFISNDNKIDFIVFDDREYDIKQIFHNIYVSSFLNNFVSYVPNFSLSLGIFKIKRKNDLSNFFDINEKFVNGESYIYIKENIPYNTSFKDYVNDSLIRKGEKETIKILKNSLIQISNLYQVVNFDCYLDLEEDYFSKLKVIVYSDYVQIPIYNITEYDFSIETTVDSYIKTNFILKFDNFEKSLFAIKDRSLLEVEGRLISTDIISNISEYNNFFSNLKKYFSDVYEWFIVDENDDNFGKDIVVRDKNNIIICNDKVKELKCNETLKNFSSNLSNENFISDDDIEMIKVIILRSVLGIAYVYSRSYNSHKLYIDLKAYVENFKPIFVKDSNINWKYFLNDFNFIKKMLIRISKNEINLEGEINIKTNQILSKFSYEGDYIMNYFYPNKNDIPFDIYLLVKNYPSI